MSLVVDYRESGEMYLVGGSFVGLQEAFRHGLHQ
jgi:hypothetical protein